MIRRLVSKLMPRPIRRNSKGEWLFVCPNCPKVHDPHYSRHSAEADRVRHSCGNVKK